MFFGSFDESQSELSNHELFVIIIFIIISISVVSVGYSHKYNFRERTFKFCRMVNHDHQKMVVRNNFSIVVNIYIKHTK